MVADGVAVDLEVAVADSAEVDSVVAAEVDLVGVVEEGAAEAHRDHGEFQTLG